MQKEIQSNELTSLTKQGLSNRYRIRAQTQVSETKGQQREYSSEL